MYNVTWFALTRGPLVYAANGLIGGKDRERAFQLNEEAIQRSFIPGKTPEGFNGPAFEFMTPDRESLLFLPYFEADGRNSGTWRLTWIQNAIDEAQGAE